LIIVKQRKIFPVASLLIKRHLDYYEYFVKLNKKWLVCYLESVYCSTFSRLLLWNYSLEENFVMQFGRETANVSRTDYVHDYPDISVNLSGSPDVLLLPLQLYDLVN
jgi:hypothetical protein